MIQYIADVTISDFGAAMQTSGSKLQTLFDSSADLMTSEDTKRHEEWGCWYHTYLPESFELGILSSCRQLHHEASHPLFIAQTFAFNDPDELRRFMYRMQCIAPVNLRTLRSIHLDIFIELKADEYAWNAALCNMAQKLDGLEEIHIVVDGLFQYRLEPHFLEDQPLLKTTFLKGIYKLKELPIKIFTVVIPSRVDKSHNPDIALDDQTYHAQKQIWSRQVRDAILKKDA